MRCDCNCGRVVTLLSSLCGFEECPHLNESFSMDFNRVLIDLDLDFDSGCGKQWKGSGG